jgi:hypothetical protein
MSKKSESGMNDPDHISESLEAIFWVKIKIRNTVFPYRRRMKKKMGKYSHSRWAVRWSWWLVVGGGGVPLSPPSVPCPASPQIWTPSRWTAGETRPPRSQGTPGPAPSWPEVLANFRKLSKFSFNKIYALSLSSLQTNLRNLL